MKRLFCIIILFACSVAAFSQNTILRQRLEIASVDFNDGLASMEVFQMQDNGQYYLSVGHLGVGDDIVQIKFDPIFELFIPLGGTLAEAYDTLQQLKDFYKEPTWTSVEWQGCLAAAYPNDKMQPVKITSRKLVLTKLLEFSIDTDDDLTRATFIPRSEFNSLVSSVQFYRKLHPKEQ